MVQKVAGQISHGADMDDLISAGTVGLVKAAAAYDPSRDTEFKTYAYIRIRGAVLDELRDRLPATPKVLKQVRHLRKCYMRLIASSSARRMTRNWRRRRGFPSSSFTARSARPGGSSS